MKHTKEQIESYRNAVIEELRRLEVEPNVNIEQVIDEFRVCPDPNMDTYIDYNSPRECAELLCL